ncbi:DinB family protein [Paenibacillus sp. LHD-117]|uniref:DinB family protein n=1 Tax=Paenibacillus sp. LHD-117 TaxID=3071412 RepID=UPI0027E0F47A|nr:DinB family protein [Paenibacillus sp. LHD-117]MDQ6419307.1 DinB family protein [Paenibacillus sp. LHD-117]
MGNTATSAQSTIAAYVKAYEEIEREIAGLTVEELRWKAAPASWSVTEVFSHLVDHSIVVSFRIREILAGSTVRLPAFDQDAWVAGQKANEEHVAHIAAAAHSLVAYNARLLARLTKEEWSAAGVNAKGDKVTIADIIPAFVAHVERHLGQIRRIKEQAASGKDVR